MSIIMHDDRFPMCKGECGQGDEPCPHPQECEGAGVLIWPFVSLVVLLLLWWLL